MASWSATWTSTRRTALRIADAGAGRRGLVDDRDGAAKHAHRIRVSERQTKRVSEGLSHTPLFARHREAGAKLAPFAGFEMPVVYDSIVLEHQSVRNQAGLFDVSHMGEIRLVGADAAALAQRLFTNDVESMQPGRVRYGMLLDEDGGVIDDVTLYRVSEQELFFCVNAANTANDHAWMRDVLRSARLACQIEDESAETALLALQGPAAIGIIVDLLPDGETPPRRWRYRRTELAGISVGISRTGYTGEDGVEIYVRAQDAVRLWDRLLAAGELTPTPAGLGARDTLRLEMGYPLYGHELDRAHTPIEANLERFVAFRDRLHRRGGTRASPDLRPAAAPRRPCAPRAPGGESRLSAPRRRRPGHSDQWQLRSQRRAIDCDGLRSRRVGAARSQHPCRGERSARAVRGGRAALLQQEER